MKSLGNFGASGKSLNARADTGLVVKPVFFTQLCVDFS
jgi:hypothetical protein